MDDVGATLIGANLRRRKGTQSERGLTSSGRDHAVCKPDHHKGRPYGRLGRLSFADGLPSADYSARHLAKRFSARRTTALSRIAMAASTLISPNNLVGSKFWVKSVVK